MPLLNTKGIKITHRHGVDYVDPVIDETRTETELIIYNGYFTYKYDLVDITKTEYYDPNES